MFLVVFNKIPIPITILAAQYCIWDNKRRSKTTYFALQNHMFYIAKPYVLL